jgi:hypothetical protein
LDLFFILFWAASIGSLIGAYMVGEHNKKGFLIWMVTNPVLAVAAHTTNSSYGEFMFIAFWIFALRGYFKKSKPLLIIEDDKTMNIKDLDPNKYMTKQEFIDWITKGRNY